MFKRGFMTGMALMALAMVGVNYQIGTLPILRGVDLLSPWFMMKPGAEMTDKSGVNTQPRQMLGLQYLRAVAALLVVFHHARNPSNGLFNPVSDWNFGQGGVDIFFLISGYIMFAVARNEPPLTFLKRRVVRIVPLYWLATLLHYVQIAVGFPGVLPTGVQLLNSMLFIPQYHWTSPTEIWPLVVPGWTLQFEMYFYLIFAVGLAFKRLVPVSLAIGLAAVALGWIGPNEESAVFTTYTSPLILEFFAGMLLAFVHRTRSLRALWAALPVGCVALALVGNLEGPRLLVWGLPALMIFVGTLAIEDAGKMPDWRTFRLLGDASYSIYLSHAFVLQFGLILWWKVPVTGWTQFIIFLPAAIIGCAIIGVIIHLYVEKPMLSRLQTKRRRPALIAAVAAA